MRHLIRSIFGLVALGFASAANAFPDRPVSIIVPWAARGGTDTVVRIFAAGFEKGLTPMSLGVGDRPLPGSYLTYETLLQKLGTSDYDKLLKGTVPYSDPRVVDTLKLLRGLIDAGLPDQGI